MGHSRTPTQNTAGDGSRADPIDGYGRRPGRPSLPAPTTLRDELAVSGQPLLAASGQILLAAHTAQVQSVKCHRISCPGREPPCRWSAIRELLVQLTVAICTGLTCDLASI
jgi:hypothetical protein